MYKIIILVTILIIVWSHIKNTRKIKENIINSFGKERGKTKSEDEMKTIAYYFNKTKRDKDIDEITWNDLDMNKIFNDMNTTLTDAGEEYLYALLHKVQYKEDLLLERDRVTRVFEKNEDIRVKLQMIFYQLGKKYNHSVYETLDKCRSLELGSMVPHFLIAFVVIISFFMFFWNQWIGGISFLISSVISIVSYYRTMRKIPDINQWYLKYFAKLLRSTSKISKLHCDELDSYFLELSNIRRQFKGTQIKSIFLSSGAGFVAEVFDLILDYLRMLTHVDIIIIYDMSKTIEKKFTQVEELFEIIGFLDSMICVTAYKRQLPYYSTPSLTNDKTIGLKITDLYHPLVEEPIANSIDENKGILITGSNATGKSTFLKAIAMNGILSQTIFVSTSKQYYGNYYQIYTSMALADNIFNNESYFIVEIKALKRIIEGINNDIPILCCIDEVLRGTNTLERIAASSEVLEELGKSNALCIVATHDIELAHILKTYYANYYFKEKIVEEEIVFNYKLYKGISTTRNAIKLLKMLGYSSDIVNKANHRLNSYQKTGSWD